MKKTLLILSALMLAFVSCKNGNNGSENNQTPTPEVQVSEEQPAQEQPVAENSKYNPTDARTFGVVGPVQEVRLYRALLSTTSTEEQGDSWLVSDEVEMSFDEYGRVTKDGYDGCPYVYDENGNFIRGFSDKTELKRDDKGRIVSYVNTNIEGKDYSEIDFDHYLAKSFEYDELNRVSKSEHSGWEWMYTETYTYFGGNVYPSSSVLESTAESLVIEGTTTYEYIKFDQYGNWTERKATTHTVTRDCGGAGEPETEDNKYLERRTFKFYSE